MLESNDGLIPPLPSQWPSFRLEYPTDGSEDVLFRIETILKKKNSESVFRFETECITQSCFDSKQNGETNNGRPIFRRLVDAQATSRQARAQLEGELLMMS